MKRKLLKQMRNEWRDNLWLVIALTVVSLSVWILFLSMWKDTSGIFVTRGFDPEDVYTIGVSMVPEESPEYVDYGDDYTAMRNEDLRFLMSAIRRSPNVEAAAWVNNCTPYETSFYGYQIISENEEDTLRYSCNARWASPDIARILRLESLNGKTPEELGKRLAKGQTLVSTAYTEDSGCRPEELLGKTVRVAGDTVNRYRVADVIEYIKRTDYEYPRWGGTVVIPIDDENPGNVWNMLVRVKPGCGNAFSEEFDATPAMQQHRNFYLSKITSLEDLGKSVHASTETSLRASVGLMAVILFVILLGLLGTFWFRVQQRVQEIAIRKVCGANDRQIFSRIIGEGMLLLVFATLIGGIIFWIAYKVGGLDTINVFQEVSVCLWMELLTTCLLAVGVSVSLWWPARKAMRIEPAVAIKDE